MRGSPFRLDVSAFAGNPFHQGFELQKIFNCPVEIAAETDIRNILGWQFFPWIRRVLARPSLAAFCRDGFIIEPHFHYWSGIHDVPRASYLHGNWQSEKYFQEIAAVIRSDFAFKVPVANRNVDLARQIGKVNAVSLHVRRGDYAADPKTNANHGLCSLDYYRKALRLLNERVDQPEIFIFSDDIAWVKANLDIDLPCLFVDHNMGMESYNDMRLMSLCQHHIIANSSFSWWGAWLNPNPDKVVIAPQRWFANANKNVDDLFPEGWVLL
jgi:hypothetical protein